MTNAKFPTIIQSNNIFQDILLPLRERKVSPDDNDEHIFFYRYIGLDEEKEYYDKILNLHRDLSKLDNLYLMFKGKIDIPLKDEFTDKISTCVQNLSLEQFVSGDIVDILQQNRLIDFSSNASLNGKYKEALREVIRLYCDKEKLNNISIGMNFVIKLLYWSREYIPNLFGFFITIYNPKILYYGEIKKHEAYFLILLSLIGCDVLFINSLEDKIFKTIDKDNRYSLVLEGTNRAEVKDIQFLVNKTDSVSTSTKEVAAKDKAVVINSENIFKDVLVPINKRKDYLENTVYPVFFQRYIGVNITEGSMDDYYNALYNLDKKLKASRNGYLKFENLIPMAENEDNQKIISELPKDPNFFDLNNKDIIIKKLTDLRCFPRDTKGKMDSEIKKAFGEVISLYIHNEKNINSSKLKNFVVKFIGWINKYMNQLFREMIVEDNPKTLYYGEIKAHEIYLLIFFSKIGCDIIYISSDWVLDESFKHIDTESQLTRLTQLKDSKPLEEFPRIERQVRKATVAYSASQEIQQAIYDADTGLFKARQYENGTTVPVGIKTTYDELKLLWKEPSKLRPEFKVEGNTVYVPNLFVKINGVYEDLRDYWVDYKFFIEGDNTYLVKNVPFSWPKYTKQELFYSAYVLNEKGLVDENKLFSSNIYKFSYLKNSIQSLIVKKINELIILNPFKQSMDEKFNLKILMTILNMDNEVLKLIERFDFTSYVPKIVIYSNAKENFNQEDAIILAFMRQIGADIVLFNPTNYNNIEMFIKDNLFDVIQLPSVAFELQIPNLKTISKKSPKTGFAKLFDFKGGKRK